MTVIRGRQLTTFDVSPDGESFAIHGTDEQAQPGTLVLPAECLNALMMTLPEMGLELLRMATQSAFASVEASGIIGS
jgi:hypothetical protein